MRLTGKPLYRKVRVKSVVLVLVSYIEDTLFNVWVLTALAMEMSGSECLEKFVNFQI